MRANEFLNESQLITDVPNEEWLQGKIDYAKSRGRNSYGVPYMTSSTTAVVKPNIRLPVSLLKRLPGMRGEQSNVRYDDLKAIMKIMHDTGKLPLTRSGEEYAPFVVVAHNGEAWVSEGNHRIMAAARLGWDTLPVELKYFDGGERIKSGPLYPPKIGLNAPEIDEMALAKYQPMGDFTKPGPFRGPDKKLVPHPVNQLKTQKFFERTPYDFRLFFSNIPGTGQYSEYGPMGSNAIKEIFKDQAEQILDGSEDAITIVFVGNKGDSKVMLTPWMMAHRFGHAIVAGNRNVDKRWGAWREAEQHFFGQINNLLKEYYNKTKFNQFDTNVNWQLRQEYNALFNAIGTQRSSRTGQIRRPYEFLYEIFAQYLGTGHVNFNPLPTNLGYGRKSWGKSTNSLNIKPEYRDENERKQIADRLAYDMELMFSDVLASSVGKIFVM